MSEFNMRLTTYPILIYTSLILHVVFLIELNAGQKFSPPPALKSSLQAATSSKINRLSSSKFRESISKVQQTYQQPIQQQQITSSFVSNEQRGVQQQPSQSTQFTEQQQSVNDLTSVQNHDDSQSTSSSESIYGSVQGTPGVDFPNYSAIPNTKFTCEGLPFEPGMYADESTGCQVYHLCYDGRRESFLCGIGTVFNQAILNCDFWHSVDCSKSALHFGANADFGKSVPEPGGNNNNNNIIQSSVSQTSISRLEQSALPVSHVQQQVAVEEFRKSSLAQPMVAQNLVVRGQSFESRQQLSGGKISPPRQQVSTNLANRLRSVVNEGVASPGRRAALLNRVSNGAQQITSAESSMIKSLSMQTGGIKSGKINSAASGLKTAVDQNQIIANREEKFAMTLNAGLNLPPSGSVKGNSFRATKDQSLDQSDKSIWKPYSRSKGKTSSNSDAVPSGASSVPPAPVHQMTNATSADSVVPSTSTDGDGANPTSATPDTPLPTVAQADQEPTFSSNDNSQPSAASEVPNIPNSNTPPPTEAPVENETPSEASSSASIESDISPALTTTTSAPASESLESSAPATTTTTTEPNDSSPASGETPDPANITTTTVASDETSPPPEDADSSKPTTTVDGTAEITKSSVETPDATTTTSNPTGPDSEASSQIDTTTTSKPESESQTGDAANEADSESKKKRGVSVVEYASWKNVKKSDNSSSVVYAPRAPAPERGRELENLPHGQANTTGPNTLTPVARNASQAASGNVSRSM